MAVALRALNMTDSKHIWYIHCAHSTPSMPNTRMPCDGVHNLGTSQYVQPHSAQQMQPKMPPSGALRDYDLRPHSFEDGEQTAENGLGCGQSVQSTGR